MISPDSADDPTSVLAQVNSSQAVLTTLAYRLASCRAPRCAGPVAYVMFRIRYHPGLAPGTQSAPLQ